EAWDVARDDLFGPHVAERPIGQIVPADRFENVPPPRAPEAETREAAGNVPNLHTVLVAELLADPAQVMVAERRARDQPEAIFGEPGYGEIALDAAAPVQHLRVDDGPDRSIDVVGAHPLE